MYVVPTITPIIFQKINYLANLIYLIFKLNFCVFFGYLFVLNVQVFLIKETEEQKKKG